MSLSSLDHDTLLQDKIRLDSEIRCMTDSLVRLQQENDKLSNRNVASADGIVLREAGIKEELERNEMEVETLLQERGLMEDTFAHEQLTLETEVQRYQHAIKRYHELLQENEQLRKTTLEVLGEISDTVMSNETELHSINKQQLQFRLKLEDDLRKKLEEVERKQQEESFSALPARAKEMLFDNAKLKDEIFLQAVGIRSIDTRAEREKTQMRQIWKQVQLLRSHGDQLRSEITDAATIKRGNEERIAELKATTEDLRDQEEAIELRAATADAIDMLEQQTQEYLAVLHERNEEIAMWSRRITSLNEMMKRLRITRAYSAAPRGQQIVSARASMFREALAELSTTSTDNQNASTFSYVSSASSRGRVIHSGSNKDLGIHSDFSKDRELTPILRSVRRFSMTAVELGTQPKSLLVSTVQQVLETWEETQVPERVHKHIPRSDEGPLGEFLQRHKYLKSCRSTVDRSLKSSHTSQTKPHSPTNKPTDWRIRLKRSLGSTSSISFGSSVSCDSTQHPLLTSSHPFANLPPNKAAAMEQAFPQRKRSSGLPQLRRRKHLIKGEARVRPVAHLIATIEGA